MTPRQLSTLRHRLGWTQARLAEVLDVHKMTVSKWERGTQPVPRSVEIAMHCLSEHASA